MENFFQCKVVQYSGISLTRHIERKRLLRKDYNIEINDNEANARLQCTIVNYTVKMHYDALFPQNVSKWDKGSPEARIVVRVLEANVIRKNSSEQMARRKSGAAKNSADARSSQ